MDLFRFCLELEDMCWKSRRSYLFTASGILFIQLITFAADAAGATYYLSTTGSNSNSGTSSAPWKTFSFAVAQLQAGDTLLLKDGTYTRANSGMLSVDCRINANGT